MRALVWRRPSSLLGNHRDKHALIPPSRVIDAPEKTRAREAVGVDGGD